MPTLSSGLVIAGAFADKIRRTLFAQARNEVDNQEVVRASAELNRILYMVLVERLKIDKGDVVRVRIDYTIENGRINWSLNSLQVEAFKRIPDEEVSKNVSEVIENIQSQT